MNRGGNLNALSIFAKNISQLKLIYMKNAFSILFTTLVFSASAWAGSPGVTFLLRNGQKVSFAFAQKPVIAVNNSDLSVSVSGAEQVSYAYADVQHVFFSNDVASGISSVLSGSSHQGVVFSWQNGLLQSTGLMPGEQVRVYSLDGKLALSSQAQCDGTLQLSFSSQPKGVYVVRTQGGLSYKLFNK